MAEARVRDEWSRTSSVMALLANAHRDPKRTSPYRPSDFDPFSKPIQPIKVSVDVLKDVFLHGMVPEQVTQGGPT